MNQTIPRIKEDKEMMKFNAQKEMDRRFPQEELSYRNMIVGRAIMEGKSDKITEDWLRRTLLMDVEDGLLTYGQAVAVKDEYFKAVQEVKKMF